MRRSKISSVAIVHLNQDILFWNWGYHKKYSRFLLRLSQLDPIRFRYIIEAVGFIVFLVGNFLGKALTSFMRLIFYEARIGLGGVRMNLPILEKVVESCLEYSWPNGCNKGTLSYRQI